MLTHPTSEADLDRRASDLIDAMLAFRWASDSVPNPPQRALNDVCAEAADLVTFCLARTPRPSRPQVRDPHDLS